MKEAKTQPSERALPGAAELPLLDLACVYDALSLAGVKTMVSPPWMEVACTREGLHTKNISQNDFPGIAKCIVKHGRRELKDTYQTVD